MKNLVIVGHHDFNNSVFNKQLVDKIKNVPNTTINILDNTFKIDIAKEQKLLVEAENIILQFPLNWYSVPAVLKNYIDKVFAYGFAYGPEGDKLKNKKYLLSVTTGGPLPYYTPSGKNLRPVLDYLFHIDQSFNLCGVKKIDTLIMHAPASLPNNEWEDCKNMYLKTISSL